MDKDNVLLVLAVMLVLNLGAFLSGKMQFKRAVTIYKKTFKVTSPLRDTLFWFLPKAKKTVLISVEYSEFCRKTNSTYQCSIRLPL